MQLRNGTFTVKAMRHKNCDACRGHATSAAAMAALTGTSGWRDSTEHRASSGQVETLHAALVVRTRAGVR